jgi:hypothetical protein
MTYVLHNTNSLLRLADKLILSLLNLRSRLLAQVILHAVFPASLTRKRKRTTLGISLCRIEAQPRILNRLASASRKLDVRVQRCAPARQEAALDLGVLRQSRLADLLAGDGVLLETSCQRILAGRGLLRGEHVRGVDGGAGNGMAERLGLRLRRGGSSEGGLGFGGGGGRREKVDLLRNGAAEIVEGLADVGWIVVGFVGVLRTRRSDWGARGALREAVRDLEHGRVHLFQRIDALLKLNVVRRELGLSYFLLIPSSHSLRELAGSLEV